MNDVVFKAKRFGRSEVYIRGVLWTPRRDERIRAWVTSEDNHEKLVEGVVRLDYPTEYKVMLQLDDGSYWSAKYTKCRPLHSSDIGDLA